MSNEEAKIQLSNRELQVLELVVTGASNQEIAQQLVISINTVKVHVRNIFNKLEVQSRTEASLRAIQEGLVDVAESDPEVNEESESTPLKSYLVDANPALVLPQWQQFYLLAALVLAFAVAFIPVVSRESRRVVPQVPVIYGNPASVTPLPQTNGNDGRWAAHPSIAGGRAALALVGLDQRIFAIGGIKDNNTATRSVEIYNAETKSWSEGASKPTAAARIMGAVIDDQIYIPGGCTHQGQALDILEIYNPATDRWSAGPSLPQARCSYGLVALNDTLYLFGGWNGETFEDSIFTFSLENNEWQVLETTLPQSLGFMGAGAIDDTIYIVGGYDGQNEFDATYAFNPDTGQWQEKAPLNEKRGGLGLISNGRNLFAVGGGWNQPLSNSEKYNPATDTWTTFDTPTTSHWRDMGLTTTNNAIYAVGGWDDSEEKFMDAVVSYQIAFEVFLPISVR